MNEIFNRKILSIFNFSKLKNPNHFKTWITKILINISLDKIKSQKQIDIFDNMEPLIRDVSYINLEEKLDLSNALDLLNYNYKTALIIII